MACVAGSSSGSRCSQVVADGEEIIQREKFTGGVLGIFCEKLLRYLSRNTLVPDIQTKSLPINIAHYNDFAVQVRNTFWKLL
jgi:hypothetical protein